MQKERKSWQQTDHPFFVQALQEGRRDNKTNQTIFCKYQQKLNFKFEHTRDGLNYHRANYFAVYVCIRAIIFKGGKEFFEESRDEWLHCIVWVSEVSRTKQN